MLGGRKNTSVGVWLTLHSWEDALCPVNVIVWSLGQKVNISEGHKKLQCFMLVVFKLNRFDPVAAEIVWTHFLVCPVYECGACRTAASRSELWSVGTGAINLGLL